jgi:hypothetical protein
MPRGRPRDRAMARTEEWSPVDAPIACIVFVSVCLNSCVREVVWSVTAAGMGVCLTVLVWYAHAHAHMHAHAHVQCVYRHTYSRRFPRSARLQGKRRTGPERPDIAPTPSRRKQQSAIPLRAALALMLFYTSHYIPYYYTISLRYKQVNTAQGAWEEASDYGSKEYEISRNHTEIPTPRYPTPRLATRKETRTRPPWGTTSPVLENLRWARPRCLHDFHSSSEGAPRPRRRNLDAQLQAGAHGGALGASSCRRCSGW